MVPYKANSQLNHISLPDRIASIGRDAFNCINLQKVYVSSLENWMQTDFEDPSSSPSTPMGYTEELYIGGELLTELFIPEGTMEIDECRFMNCRSLQKVVFPDNLRAISNNAFSGCTNLVNISFPGNLTAIGIRAFMGCSK